MVGVLLQLTAGLAVAAQVVVCRTPSGHVAIETELSDCCPGGGHPLHEVSSSACDGCVDTPLFHPGLLSTGKVTLGLVPASPWSALISTRAVVLRHALAPPTGTNRPRGTVVLLI
jgi:hypothetical protein